MKGRPQDYMDVGLVHFMAFPATAQGEGPVVESLRTVCEDDYFQAVEVSRIRDAAARAEAIALVKQAGMQVGFGAHPALLAGAHDLNSCDAVVRRQALDVARACLAEAVEWNACALVVLSGKDPGEEARPAANAMLIASLKELCEFSRRSTGLAILLETFDRVPFGKNCLIGPTEEAAHIADKVYPNCMQFGLVLDQGHLPLLNETPAAALKTAAPYLRLAHIGNCVMRDPRHPAYGDNHPPFGIEAGENGVDQLAEFLKALLEIGYIAEGRKNIVSFEVKPYGDMTSEQVIAQAKETLDAAWAAL